MNFLFAAISDDFRNATHLIRKLHKLIAERGRTLLVVTTPATFTTITTAAVNFCCCCFGNDSIATTLVKTNSTGVIFCNVQSYAFWSTLFHLLRDDIALL